MFYYLNGKVTVKEQNMVAIDVGGVGYAVHTSYNTSSKLEKGKEALVYTYCNIREDAFDIFGFIDLEELNFFKLLIGINGVGPKAGLAILSVANPASLALAIITGDEKLITKAQGIGKKIAQRIVLELKDKVAKDKIAQTEEFVVQTSDSQTLSETISALMVLGYTQIEAQESLKGVSAELTSEQMIKEALKNLMKQG